MSARRAKRIRALLPQVKGRPFRQVYQFAKSKRDKLHTLKKIHEVRCLTGQEKCKDVQTNLSVAG